MFKWRLLVQGGRKSGHAFSQPDLIIAATALQYGLTVVTRDTGDCERAGVTLLDPWLRSLPSGARSSLTSASSRAGDCNRQVLADTRPRRDGLTAG